MQTQTEVENESEIRGEEEGKREKEEGSKYLLGGENPSIHPAIGRKKASHQRYRQAQVPSPSPVTGEVQVQQVLPPQFP